MSKFKEGDRVIARYEGPGEVIRAAKESALVRFDGLGGLGPSERRVSLGGLRYETSKDVCEREHAEAVRAWDAARPKADHVQVVYRKWGRPDEVSGFTVPNARTTADVLSAAAEPQALADWFEKRPVMRQTDGGDTRE